MAKIINGQWVTEDSASATKPLGSSSNESVSGSTNSSSTKSSNSTTTNMTPGSLAALEALTRQLASGGTTSMKQDRALRNNEIGTLTKQRQGYSKEAAFADSQGLMAQQMRLALEKLLPGINTGALGAGSSQSSMRALLTQRAAENAAQNAQAAGLGAAVSYGGVANGISGILQNLILAEDPSVKALLSALNIAKGAVTNTSGTETTNTAGTSSSAGSISSSSNKGGSSSASNSNYANVGPAAPGLQFFGPQQTDLDIAKDNLRFTGTTADTLQQLAGLGSNRWSGMTF